MRIKLSREILSAANGTKHIFERMKLDCYADPIKFSWGKKTSAK